MQKTITEKVLYYSILAGVFAVLFAPFIVANNMFFPFISGKGFAFRIISEIVFFLWVILAFMDRQYLPKKSRILCLLAAFVAVIFAADMFGANPFKSFWSNFERMEGFALILHLFGFFLAASSVLSSEKLWNWFLNTAVGASVLMCFYGFLQLAGKITINQGGVRLDGTFGNAAYLAVYMLVNMFLASFLFARFKGSQWVRWIYAVAIFFQFIILYYTATRGALIGLAAGIALASVLAFIFEKENKLRKKIAAGVFIALALAVLGFVFLRNSNFVKNSPVLTRFASISVSDATPRFMVWGMAWRGFLEHPILGWGQENFNFVFNKYYNPKMYSQEQWFDRTHDIFLDWLIAGGLLGLLGYLSLFGALICYIWRGAPGALGAGRTQIFSVPEKSVLTGLLAAYFVNNIFVFDNLGSYILFFSLLAFVHSRVVSASGADVVCKKWLDGNESGAFARIAPPLAVVLLIFSLYYFNYKGIMTNLTLIEALKSQPAGFAKNIEYFKQAGAYNSLGRQEVAEQASLVATQVGSQGNAPAELKQQMFDLGNQLISKEVEHNPNDARIRVFRGTLYNRLGMYAQAIPELEKAVSLSPAKQTILYELGSAYLNLSETPKAFDVFKKAYDLAPESPESAVIYLVGAISAGKNDIVSALISKNPALVADNRVLQAFARMGQWDPLFKILAALIAQNPSNVDYLFLRAQAYVHLGSRSAAIADLRQVEKIRPESKDQIENYIKQIQAGKNPQ